jgi:hypothetical protein
MFKYEAQIKEIEADRPSKEDLPGQEIVAKDDFL